MTLFLGDLKTLTDDILENRIKKFVAYERAVLVQILQHLREVEARRLHLKRGYGSLFDYCVRVLGYSEPEASRRIAAMRLIKEIPEVTAKIESGHLSLSNVASAQLFFKRIARPVTLIEKRELLAKIENTTKRECERVLLSISPEAALPAERERQLTVDKTEIRFVADAELMKKFEKLKYLLSHSLVDASYAELFELLADEMLKRKDPLLKKTRSSSTPPAESQRANRYIPAKLRAAVWKRDLGTCRYRDEATGRVCESRFQLQIDHKIPIALGGKTVFDNLELVCRNHNMLRATEKLGATVMNNYWTGGG